MIDTRGSRRRFSTAGLLLAGILTFGMCAQAGALAPPPAQKADIYFESGGRIMSMKADGSERTILTREGLPLDDFSDSADSSPRVSPDGSSIVFSRYLSDGVSDAVTQIVTMDRDGGNERVLLPNEASPGSDDSGVYSPVWSADSKRIFFVRLEQHARKFVSEIRSIKADGSGMRRISRSVLRFTREKIIGSPLLPLEVAPSPDGKKLLVTWSRIYGGKPSRMFLVDPVTGKRKLLQRDASSGSWSPDGSRITFISERDRLNKGCYEGFCSYDPQVYVMKANGSGARRLIPGKAKGFQFSPDWSANGGRIAYVDGLLDEIFSIRPDGKCRTRLTNGSPDSGSPDWGPEPGRSSSPGTCGDAVPEPVAEFTPGTDILDLKLAPFWLGSRYRDRLLDSIFKDGRAVEMSYDDCGSLNESHCSQGVSLTSGPVCEALSDSVFYDGTFKRLVERKGALVMLAEASGGGLESIVYSGGLETGIYTVRSFHGKKVRHADHLAVVDAMRPVTTSDPVAKFEPPVFKLTEVRLARAVLRSWKRLGTLAEAAEKQGMFPKMAGAYLRFGKALQRRGKVLTVKCHRRKEVPGSIKPR